MTGVKKYIYDLWGDTVNLASHMESQGGADVIEVTEASFDLLAASNRFVFGSARTIDVKGRGLMRTRELIGFRSASAP